MAIEAPYSKYNRTNFKICIVLCIGVAIAFAYDGYLSKYEWSLRRSFYEEHVKDGKPDSDMVINQKAPVVLVTLAAILTVLFLVRKNNKLIADENELIFNDKKRIPYDAIEKINKTHFRSKHESATVKREFVGHPNSVLEESNEEVKEECKDEPTGYFIITYKNKDGKEINQKLSDRKYDNLAAILDHLVAKIS